MCRKLVRSKQDSIFNKQEIDSCESNCVCANGAGVSRETSDILCKAEEAREAWKACTADETHEAGEACSAAETHEAGKAYLAERTRESEVLSRQRAKQTERRSAFGLSFYDNTDMDVFAQKSYRSDMSDEELKRSRKRDWAYIFIGVPLLIGVIYLIALIAKAIK